jgi:hypothetical protein
MARRSILAASAQRSDQIDLSNYSVPDQARLADDHGDHHHHHVQQAQAAQFKTRPAALNFYKLWRNSAGPTAESASRS